MEEEVKTLRGWAKEQKQAQIEQVGNPFLAVDYVGHRGMF